MKIAFLALILLVPKKTQREHKVPGYITGGFS